MVEKETDSQVITGPILGRPGDFPDRPRRLGRGGRFFAYLVIGALVAVLAAGWGYVMMTSRGDPQVRGQIISFEVADPAFMTMTFTVSKPAGRAAACRLRATGADRAEVGSREIRVAAGDENVTLTERLETSAQATNGHIQYCYLVQ